MFFVMFKINFDRYGSSDSYMSSFENTTYNSNSSRLLDAIEIRGKEERKERTSKEIKRRTKTKHNRFSSRNSSFFLLVLFPSFHLFLLLSIILLLFFFLPISEKSLSAIRYEF